MNLKTTIVLALLVGAGIGVWMWLDSHKPAETTASPTQTVFESKLTADKLKRIEVARARPLDPPALATSSIGLLSLPIGKGLWLTAAALAPRMQSLFVLEKTGTEWGLSGNWPVRPQETNEWIATLTTLHSRFAPEPLNAQTPLKAYGLGDEALVIRVTLDGETHLLRFGEEPSETNRFTRATYVQLDDQPEVIRLGPGVLAALDRKPDYFQRRRLFEIDRVAKDEDAKDKIEQLDATAVVVQTASEKFTIAKKDKEWLLRAAAEKKDKQWKQLFSEDRLDPDKRRAFLAAFSDLWAESFIDQGDKSLDDLGLKEPEYTLAVTRPNGAKLTLLIGKVSDTKIRAGAKPPPPNPFGPPPKPPEIVVEEYRYAKLANNDQLFTIKANKLKDIAPSFEALRDPQLARFAAKNVKRLEMRHGDQDLVLVKVKDDDKEKWRFEKPVKQDAETKQVEEILDKLAGLQARDKEILDNKIDDLKPAGMVKITVEEEDKDDKKNVDVNKKTRDIVFHLSNKAKEKDKLYVRVDAWPRENQVGADLLTLVQRPVLAYRNRRILDLAAADLHKIEVQRPGETFAFEKHDGRWKLAAPVQADVDPAKINELTGDLGKLEGVEFISDNPKAEELDKIYGLAKPSLTVKLYYKEDSKKEPQTLMIGQPRAGKQDFYARLDQGPVFAVKKDLRNDLDRSSLSYRPLQLWQLNPEAISTIDVKKDGAGYHLKKQGLRWQITQPFDAEAMPAEVEAMAVNLARLRCERYEAHQAKDPLQFGFDKSARTIQFSAEDGSTHALEIGKAVDNSTQQRYARVAGQEAVMVIDEKALAGFNRDALDLIAKMLLSLNPRGIQQIRVQAASPFTLEPVKDQWQVVGSPAPTFQADEAAVTTTLAAWTQLRAEKFAAYGPNIDWKRYGLDKPAVTIHVVVMPGEGEKTKKGGEHVLELGNEDPLGARFARLDKKDAVVVLDAGTVKDLNRTYLDFVDPLVLQYDADTLTGVQRQSKDSELEIVRQEEQWRILKPFARDADNLTLNDLLTKTFRLRAKRIAAYPAKDLKSFGLEKPYAVVTLQLDVGGTMKKHVIKVGNLSGDADRPDTGERYAVINDDPRVAVLSAELTRHLTAPAYYYLDRNLESFSGIDQVALQQGLRKVVFAKPDSQWQMVQPIKAEAEDAALEDLIRGVQRLRADEIVADKGADLKKYGLDAPVLQWRFKAGDTDKLHLIVGGTENATPNARRYARIGGKDEVFLLSAKLTAKVQEEYRSRKPWPALDAAQVQQVTITSANKTFALRKKEGDWEAVGEPDLKLDARKVIDTLDALAGLKVLHYVADTKADLQLYGLDKPSWKVAVLTPMGQRELWLGRTEGGSGRFYATVPGSDAVFVLSESDSVRIARPMSAFVQAGKKDSPR